GPLPARRARRHALRPCRRLRRHRPGCPPRPPALSAAAGSGCRQPAEPRPEGLIRSADLVGERAWGVGQIAAEPAACSRTVDPGGKTAPPLPVRRGIMSQWRWFPNCAATASSNALALLAEYAASIGVTRLEAHIAPDNHASRRVAESAGFSQAGAVIEDGTEMIRYIR